MSQTKFHSCFCGTCCTIHYTNPEAQFSHSLKSNTNFSKDRDILILVYMKQSLICPLLLSWVLFDNKTIVTDPLELKCNFFFFFFLGLGLKSTLFGFRLSGLPAQSIVFLSSALFFFPILFLQSLLLGYFLSPSFINSFCDVVFLKPGFHYNALSWSL